MIDVQMWANSLYTPTTSTVGVQILAVEAQMTRKRAVGNENFVGGDCYTGLAEPSKVRKKADGR